VAPTLDARSQVSFSVRAIPRPLIDVVHGRYLGDVTTPSPTVRSDSEGPLRRCCLRRMRGRRPSTVSLVDCLTRDSAGCALVGGLRTGLNKSAGHTSPIRAPRFAARLRRRKSAFGFHLITADSRPEAEDPVHPQNRPPVPGGRLAPVAGRQLPARDSLRGAGT